MLSLSSIRHIYTIIYELDRIYSNLIPSYNNTANPGFYKRNKNNNAIFWNRIRVYYSPFSFEKALKRIEKLSSDNNYTDKSSNCKD